MSRFTVAAMLVVCVVSCKEVTFKVPQPEGRKPLEKVPRSLQGRYLAEAEAAHEPSKDTIIVMESGYRFGFFDRTERESTSAFDIGVLSDSLVLTHYKGFYFVNIKHGSEWSLRVLRPERNGDLTFMILDDPNVSFTEFLERLSSEVPVDSTNTSEGEKLYQIAPSPRQLMGLIEKGLFHETRLLKLKQ